MGDSLDERIKRTLAPLTASCFDDAEVIVRMRRLLRECLDERDDLFDALKGLVRYAEAVRHTAGMGKTQLERLDAAKAVLAKAEGK